jgi:hypothetical protein
LEIKGGTIYDKAVPIMDDRSNADRTLQRSGSNGNKKTITEPAKIREWIEKVRYLKLVPDPDQEDSAGLLYQVTLFEKGEKMLGFTPINIDQKPVEPNSGLRDLMMELYESEKTSKEDSAQMTKKNPEATNWEVTSRDYYIKGEVTEINQSAGYLDAITLKVQASYPSDNDPSDEAPFPTEQVYSIKLLTVINGSELKLTKRTQVIINASQFTPKDKETPFWAGDLIGYEENGMCYDLNKKPANLTMSKHVSLKEGKLIESHAGPAPTAGKPPVDAD